MKLRALVPCLLTACLLLLGCKGGSTTPKPPGSQGSSAPSKPETKGDHGAVTAEELTKDYKAGENGADGKYKGKELTVKGVISSVRKDSVELKGMADAKGSQHVRCHFADASVVKDLKKDEEITVKGTCNGKMGSADSFTVALESCKLVK